MLEENTPSNLPVSGKSLMDNVQGEAGIAPPEKLNAQPPAVKPIPPALSAYRPLPGTPAEDMFAEVKEFPPASSAGKMAALKPAPGLGKDETMVETPRQGFKKVIIIIGFIIIFAGALSVGGYWAYNQFLKPKPLSPNLNLNTISTSPPAQETQIPPAAVTPPPAQVTAVDSDNDGLTDEEEKKLGTDSLNPDTDGDRLFDGEEVNVYRTDSLNPDTDGDGFQDGAEVQAGYDPKGPGKLIRIPAQP